jgi:glycosyltransferase involved in cell wall biosynthesis
MRKTRMYTIDTRWLGPHGIGRFTAEIQRRLALRDWGLPGSPSSPLDPLRMTWAMAKLPQDAMVFIPGYNAPLWPVRPFIFTVHDLNHLDVPNNSSASKRLYYHLVIRRACHTALRVLTVSEFSRQSIIEWAGVSPQQVVCVGNGVDASFNPEGERHDPGFGYFLMVSNRRPHKNETRVLAAFARARIDPAIRLLLTGFPTNALQAYIAQLGLTERVVFMGRVEDAQLPALYRGALGLLFPSLYEGFGLPVVEAMASGVPVLTSTVTALPGVAGDAALLVDPYEVDAIASGIERLLTDEDLRTRLRTAGLKRAATFRWDDVAARVKHVLDELALSGRD